jgi:uncharacterized protein (TIGR03000 family)
MKTTSWLSPVLLVLLALCAPATGFAQFRYDSPLGTNRPASPVAPYLTQPGYSSSYYNYGGVRTGYPGSLYVPTYVNPYYSSPYGQGVYGSLWRGTAMPYYNFPSGITRSYYFPQGQDQSLPATTSGLAPPADTRVPVAVRVPAANAEVWFGNVKTKQTGTKRSFVTPPLQPGQKYQYQVRVVWNENGKRRETSRTVYVEVGRPLMLDFTR